jgi:hypothetical protein
MRLALLASMFVLVVGCGGSGGGSSPDPSDDIDPGLQYEGSIALVQANEQVVELSAPLFPDATVFQIFQDATVYPGLSEAERLALVDDDVRTFGELLPLCAATNPAIKLQVEGDPPLTAAEIATNYDEVARCAYEQYGAKPYWVPQHVSDVDVCGRKLGLDWRLPTEADVNGFEEGDFKFFQETLTAQPGLDEFPVHFYYSLDVYVRAGDGSLALGNLAPDAEHVVPLPVSGSELDALYIGNGRPIGLRCVRVIPASP